MNNDQIPLFGARLTIESAKEVARKLMDIYDLDRDGIISFQEIPELLKDAYKGIKKPKKEITKGEQESMHNIMDTNQDGKINMEDLEALAIQ